MFHFVSSICNHGVIDEYQALLPKALSEVSGQLDNHCLAKNPQEHKQNHLRA